MPGGEFVVKGKGTMSVYTLTTTLEESHSYKSVQVVYPSQPSDIIHDILKTQNRIENEYIRNRLGAIPTNVNTSYSSCTGSQFTLPEKQKLPPLTTSQKKQEALPRRSFVLASTDMKPSPMIMGRWSSAAAISAYSIEEEALTDIYDTQNSKSSLLPSTTQKPGLEKTKQASIANTRKSLVAPTTTTIASSPALDSMLLHLHQQGSTTVDGLRENLKEFIWPWYGLFKNRDIEMEFTSSMTRRRKVESLQSMKGRGIMDFTFLPLAILYDFLRVDEVTTRSTTTTFLVTLALLGFLILHAIEWFTCLHFFKQQQKIEVEETTGSEPTKRLSVKNQILLEKSWFLYTVLVTYGMGWIIMSFSSYGQVTYAPLEILILTMNYINYCAVGNATFIFKNSVIWIVSLAIMAQQFLANNLNPATLTVMSVVTLQSVITVDDYEKMILSKVGFVMEKLKIHSQQEQDKGNQKKIRRYISSDLYMHRPLTSIPFVNSFRNVHVRTSLKSDFT
jgi:hypothetical protein